VVGDARRGLRAVRARLGAADVPPPGAAVDARAGGPEGLARRVGAGQGGVAVRGLPPVRAPRGDERGAGAGVAHGGAAAGEGGRGAVRGVGGEGEVDEEVGRGRWKGRQFTVPGHPPDVYDCLTVRWRKLATPEESLLDSSATRIQTVRAILDLLFATKDDLLDPILDMLVHGLWVLKHSPMIGIDTPARQIRNVARRRLHDVARNEQTLCSINVHGRHADGEVFDPINNQQQI
jgi:hypothetical protein